MRRFGSPGRDHRARAVVLVLLATAAACGGDAVEAERTIRDFVTAVQAEDLDRLYCLLAGAAPGSGQDVEPARREDFDAWARSRYEAYLDGRDSGGVDLGESGIVLVKAFALGKGTYHAIEGMKREAGAGLGVRSRVRFGYARANYSAFSPGTTFYVAGEPVGAIHAVVVPYVPGETSAEVLETLALRWELQRAEAGPACPARWTVAAVRPVPDSETTALVTWRF